MNPTQVKFTTSLGEILIALDAEKAPKTVENFLKYVKEGFFDNTIFHRCIKKFMVQGGGFDQKFNQKKGFDPIKNEANTGLSNLTGTIAMARTNDPHSASSQFFINVSDNLFLNFKSESLDGWGYCAFGTVTEGLDVAKKMSEVKTGERMGHRDVPTEDVVIIKAEILE